MRSTLKLQTLAGRRTRIAGLLAFAGAFAALLLLSAQQADANPHHSAGDYVIFAKALNPTVPLGTFETREPNCDGANHSQGEASGQTNQYYGRIHSNADLGLNGANTYFDTI